MRWFKTKGRYEWQGWCAQRWTHNAVQVLKTTWPSMHRVFLQPNHKCRNIWWTMSCMYFDSQGLQMSSVQVRFISALEPYRLYHFRARSKFSTGMWSEWSADVSSRTQEEGKRVRLYWRASLFKEPTLVYFCTSWVKVPLILSTGKHHWMEYLQYFCGVLSIQAIR